jgi:hypothetical protein
MIRLVPSPAAAVTIVLVVVGIVLLAVGQETAAVAVFGLGVVFAVALAFYAVGRSEDIDRERGKT